MRLGYARASTERQNLDRQLDELHLCGVDKIFEEKVSGATSDRPELQKLLDTLRKGDTVVVDSLSRLSRSTKDLLQLLERLEDRGVQLVSLHEQIDTKSPTGKLLLTVLVAISQFEREIIVQRTREGLAAARARGRVGGRPPLSRRKVEQAVKLYEGKEHALSEITSLTGVSASTLYRYLRKSVEELNA
jgi:DNA invertase Pin-like site-specific DNA recombinase